MFVGSFLSWKDDLETQTCRSCCSCAQIKCISILIVTRSPQLSPPLRTLVWSTREKSVICEAFFFFFYFFLLFEFENTAFWKWKWRTPHKVNHLSTSKSIFTQLKYRRLPYIWLRAYCGQLLDLMSQSKVHTVMFSPWRSLLTKIFLFQWLGGPCTLEPSPFPPFPTLSLSPPHVHSHPTSIRHTDSQLKLAPCY